LFLEVLPQVVCRAPTLVIGPFYLHVPSCRPAGRKRLVLAGQHSYRRMEAAEESKTAERGGR
jgi:hypothetical protein